MNFVNYVLVLYLFFGPAPGEHIAAVQFQTGLMFQTEAECKEAASKFGAKSQGIPISGGTFECEKVKTT